VNFLKVCHPQLKVCVSFCLLLGKEELYESFFRSLRGSASYAGAHDSCNAVMKHNCNSELLTATAS
jgi:hypothetical protein